jgi:hypothetical protein
MLGIGTLSMIEDDDDSSLLPLSDTSKVVLGRYYLAESLLRCVPNRSSIKEPQYGSAKTSSALPPSISVTRAR